MIFSSGMHSCIIIFLSVILNAKILCHVAPQSLATAEGCWRPLDTRKKFACMVACMHACMGKYIIVLIGMFPDSIDSLIPWSDWAEIWAPAGQKNVCMHITMCASMHAYGFSPNTQCPRGASSNITWHSPIGLKMHEKQRGTDTHAEIPTHTDTTPLNIDDTIL